MLEHSSCQQRQLRREEVSFLRLDIGEYKNSCDEEVNQVEKESNESSQSKDSCDYSSKNRREESTIYVILIYYTVTILSMFLLIASVSLFFASIIISFTMLSLSSSLF